MPDKTFLADIRLNRYAIEHSTPEPEILRRLREETASHSRAMMQISPDQGRLFALLVKLMGARRALEIGVFTGYSSLSVAMALPPDGKLIACDINEEYTSVARRYWREAGMDQKIDLRLAPAMATLNALLAEGQAGTFDFAFIDADKTGYDAYFESVLRLLRTGGLMIFDNMLQEGGVLDQGTTDPDLIAIRRLNDKLTADPRVVTVLLPIADGISLVLKLG